MKLVWFRRDLRLDDNPALHHAIEDARAQNEPVVALYVATPMQWEKHGLSSRQADLIFRRLGALQKELSDIGVALFYHQCSSFHDAAEAVIKLVDSNGVTGVYYNKDYEVDEQQRDTYLQQALSNHACHIDVIAKDGKCVLPPGSILNKQGQYFKVFTPFKRAWLTRFATGGNRPLSPPSKQLVAVNRLISDDFVLFHPDIAFDYPRESSERWDASEYDIHKKLQQFCHEHLDDYEERRDIPSTDGTSTLSAYLAIGALSARRCIQEASLAADIEHISQGAQTWISELVWREFYQHLIYFEPRLVKNENFLLWGNRLQWRQDDDWFEAWCTGNTGYPIVDAAMKQLNTTGWMHNRLRMVVASFLVKDLQIDWRKGEHYFMSKLIDGDFAANNGGWQWCASTGCDGQPYFRIFNPISQGERFDAKGEFVRQWLPELEGVPDKFVHAPWNWPQFDSLNYPSPMVDHKEQREITLALYKRAKDS
ncbi:deoxyribodipyrimidine photo-lyase [Vibrio maerlii]|uniref:deoxyribodipyrimidine photo-lyase n=1 Tax=Vibrio maerlii TaxID=2231648 RepID=UPI000E3D4043|nr:deoxyribodipyrimidine photo-lyase [Vibrio maerlii]